MPQQKYTPPQQGYALPQQGHAAPATAPSVLQNSPLLVPAHQMPPVAVNVSPHVNVTNIQGQDGYCGTFCGTCWGVTFGLPLACCAFIIIVSLIIWGILAAIFN